jgi:hypothetical protein
MFNRFIIIVYSILICSLLSAQGNPADIKKKISDIRKRTAWGDATAAKKANDSIAVLSKQLQRAYSQQNIPGNETEEQKKIRESNENYKDKLTDQIIKAAQKGKDADLLLGEVVTDEINEQYEEEEKNRNNNCPEFYETMDVLCLDMSSPIVEKLINVMENFRGIKTLIITGGENGVPVDFKEIFSKAKAYPLEKLYIINFHSFVDKVPNEIFQFKNLEFISLVSNSISGLPTSMNGFMKLKELLVDANPLVTIIDSISQLKQLQSLGIAKTEITEKEKEKIKLVLPNCKTE